MNTHDRAYLQDITQFISMNRVAAVYALYKGLLELEDVAKFTVNQIWHTEVSTDDVTGFGDTGRIQRILIAKIYAELISAYEDLGSICDAVKNRKSQERPGIFNRCISGATRQAGNFLSQIYQSDIPNHPEITLDVLLNLPSITELADLLSSNMLHDLDEIYHDIPSKLSYIAEHYYARRQDTTTVEAKDISSAVTRNEVAIIINVIFPGVKQKNSSLTVDSFNKIKHMFLVPEDLSKYTDPQATYQIEFSRFGMNIDFVKLLMQNTIAVAQIMRILANVLLHLDEIGVVL